MPCYHFRIATRDKRGTSVTLEPECILLEHHSQYATQVYMLLSWYFRNNSKYGLRLVNYKFYYDSQVFV